MLFLQLNSDFQKPTTRFIKLLQSSFPTLTVNKKVETWYEMTFGAFRNKKYRTGDRYIGLRAV